MRYLQKSYCKLPVIYLSGLLVNILPCISSAKRGNVLTVRSLSDDMNVSLVETENYFVFIYLEYLCDTVRYVEFNVR